MTWEAIAGFCAVIVALCALWLTISEGRESRKHNKLSVKPHLTTWTSSAAASGRYSVDVINNGIGPALIKNFQICVDGMAVEGLGVGVIENALKKLFPGAAYEAKQGYLAPGYVMSAKERRPVVDIVFLGQPVPKYEEMAQAEKRIRLVIEYESMYGEEYRYDSDTFRSNVGA